MADAQGQKTGGRQRGTPNKSTATVKVFLERVFERAFTEKRLIAVTHDGGRTFTKEERGLEDRLVDDIITGAIDPKQFATLLQYYAGRPVQPFEMSHSGKVSLESIIAGTAKDIDDEDPA